MVEAWVGTGLSLLEGMSTDTLFPIEPSSRPGPDPRQPDSSEPPRLRTANREQVELRACDLESLLPTDHPARAVWAVVERLDLRRFDERIQARGSRPGRAACDPRIALTLWLYATSQDVGSARELARLCDAHDAYRWICGGVSVNHHSLADFRVQHGREIDELMTQLLAVLTHQGLLTLERVSHDGMRVRAGAGAASFRRAPSLERCLEAARAQVTRVKREAEAPDTTRTARQRAAQERAARERTQRIEHALAELPKVQAVKRTVEAKEEARASTTDPEARVMKMADGGYRPAYNVQLATDTESRVIVGVGLTNRGSDQGQLEPMLDDIERRTGRCPDEYLVDGGFTRLESIEHAAARGVTVVAPVLSPRKQGVDPYQPKVDDSAAVAAWRQRMATDEAKQTYKLRAATAETVNADLRCKRALDHIPVRGTDKALTLVLWSALTYNVLRAVALGMLA